MIILFLSLITINVLAFSCKGQNNQDVDWFAVYKMPMEMDHSITGIEDGLGFYYLDANNKETLVASPNSLGSTQQAIAYTLKQFYDKKNDPTIFHIMYNDEPYVDTVASFPEALTLRKKHFDTIEYGHTKGTLFFNGQTGVWLIHSVPKFPPPGHYDYPESGHEYGQAMLCLTLPYAQLDKIAMQLYYNKPNIYSSRLPTKIAADHPILSKVIAGQYKQGEPYYSIVQLTTLAGATFKSFAKTNQFNNDLYDGLLAPTLRTNIIAETWRRGSTVPLECRTIYHTNDALAIQVGSTNLFKYTKDHSKLARSTDITKPWVCIGDINRMTSQYIRGGGTTCMSNTQLWEAFNVIKEVNHC